MATCNHVMQLGNETYLEVIAINPEAETPPQPRWFGLDQATMRAALKQQPRLITWVMNTPDIHQLTANAGFDIGRPTALSRDNLNWEIALTDDGRLLADGMLPYCIQWHSSPHRHRVWPIPAAGSSHLRFTITARNGYPPASRQSAPVTWHKSKPSPTPNPHLPVGHHQNPRRHRNYPLIQTNRIN